MSFENLEMAVRIQYVLRKSSNIGTGSSQRLERRQRLSFATMKLDDPGRVEVATEMDIGGYEIGLLRAFYVVKLDSHWRNGERRFWIETDAKYALLL